MELAPPLNLTTTVKVEELVIEQDNVPRDFTVEGELVEESAEERKENQSEDQLDGSEDDIENFEDDSEKPVSPAEVLAPKNGLIDGQKEYQCSNCDLSFSRASQLRAHERTHFEEQIYECDQCSGVFHRVAELMNHRRESHRQSFSCTECDAKFSNHNAFRVHVRRHKGDKPFKCLDCNMAFVQVCHLHIHRRVHTGEKPFTCSVCNQKFKQPSHLTTHMRIHTNDKPYKCDICTAAFSQTSSLTRHKRRHSGEKPFKCEECGALFVERRNLSRHMLTHTGERPYSCDKCGSRFAQMVDLKRHKMSHAGLKPFKCNVCEASFSRQNNLRWHKLTHEGDTPYKCEKCSAGFSLMRDLKSHMRTHAGIKPYLCDQCSATFSQMSTLKRHRLSHSGERQFVCSKCQRAFKDKSALRRHMLRHEAVKPYACHKCESTFIEFRNLKRHKVTVHGEERFEGVDVDITQPEPENNINVRPLKKRAEKSEDVPLGEIYDGNFQSATLPEQLESAPQSVANHSDINITSSLQQNQPTQPEVTTTLPPHPQLSDILTIPSQTPGQMPALLLTQPGQPPKPARPASTCQNHQSHVLTFMEGNYNQWQSWCFCDTPNIPDSSQTIVDTSGVVVNQSSTTTTVPVVTAPPPPQVNYSELPQRTQHQAVGVQEVSQADYQVNQYNNSYSDTIHHFEDTSQSDSLTPASHHQHQLGQQNTETKLEPLGEQRIFTISGIQHAEHGHHHLQQANTQQITQQQHHQHNQQQYEQQLHHSRSQLQQQQPPLQTPQPEQQQLQQQQQQQQQQTLQQHNQLEQQQPLAMASHSQHQLSANSEVDTNPQEMQPEVDPQITYQYSLTVSNPATGDIQIQSEVFPANPSNQRVGASPIKKRRPLKGDTKDLPVNRLFTCRDCPKTFSRINHLMIHQRTHTGEKPFQCGVCFQAFTHKNSLTIHMRGHTGERPYVCTVCGTSFTQKSNLRVHLRTHTGEKPFKCNMCDIAFTQGSHLTAHKRIHSNERPFSCETCHQTFTQRSALKRHSFTHSGDKPHKCDHCNARFSQRDDLKRHLRTHDSENKKDSSGAKSSNKKQKSQDSGDNKTRPQKIEAGEVKKVFSCKHKDCSSTFTDALSLSKHVRSVHENKKESPKEETKSKKNPNPVKSSEELGKMKAENIEESVIEPTRTSKRLREAAKKKKVRPENSDFIMGDFVDMIDEEVTKSTPKVKPVKKVKLEDMKVVSKEKMESWCFCEVPHGPDEPHTHMTVEAKSQAEGSSNITESTIQEVSSRQGVDNIIASADASGATSLLQLSMEHVHHNHSTPTAISEGFQNQQVTGSVSLDASSIVSTPHTVNNAVTIADTSEHQNQEIAAAGQTDSTVIINPSNNQIAAAVGHAQILNASQLVAQDGAIYIDAGGMISNGAVVINPSQGTFISYEQITISSDGQVIGVPVGGSAAETLMIQPAGATVDTSSATGTVTYTTAAQVTEPSTASQPVQYTTLGGDVLSLFSQVDSNKDGNSSDKYTVIAKPLDCSVCARSFVQKRSLWSHMQASHPELFSCSECCAAFTTAEYLKHHKSQHQKLHVCSRCGMAFTSKSILTRHRQQMHATTPAVVEEKERVYECEVCQAKFYQQSDLKRHMFGHTGEKPFRCKHCDAGFTRTSSLNKHMRIHTGEKPYVCSECDQAFAYRYQFNRHKLVHKQQEQQQQQQQQEQQQQQQQLENNQCNTSTYSMPYVFV